MINGFYMESLLELMQNVYIIFSCPFGMLSDSSICLSRGKNS